MAIKRHKATTIRELIREQRAEEPHLRHVTELALRILREVRTVFDLRRADERLLRAAAMLHDIGFPERPSKHVDHSVALLQENRLSEYSLEEQQYITAIVSLHRRNYRSVLQRSEVTQLANPDRALRLGALLRIADGLDHSHIQDCSIRSLRITRDTVTLRVDSRFYRNNVAWALGKADLWAECFDRTLNILPCKQPKGPRFQGVVSPSDATLEAFRSLLYSQFRLYVDNIAGTCEGSHSEYLHDLRVALRRARMLFTFFKPAIAQLDYKPHRDYVASLTRELGPYRDSQVWIDFLADVSSDPLLLDDPDWHHFLLLEKRRDRRHVPEIARIVKNDANERKSRALSLFLRSELPAAIREQRRTAYRDFTTRRLHKYIAKLLTQRTLTEDDDPEVAHDVRKVVRKTRYYAEYADPALPPVVHQLTKRLKAVADALGTMHDMDVHRERIRRKRGTKPPPALGKIIQRRHARAWEDYRSAWRKLTDPRFQKRVQQTLQPKGL
jgi:CHAD domain-containing protein